MKRTKKILLLFILAVLSLLPLISCDDSLSEDIIPEKGPKIIAHRGFWTIDGENNYENTIKALEEAYKGKFYGSEFDVHITKDGLLVIHHDQMIDGIDIQKNDYSAIKDLILPNGEKIPTLEEYLVKGISLWNSGLKTKLILEIKDHKENNISVAKKVYEKVKELKVPDEAIEYISFSQVVCTTLRNLDSKIIISFLASASSTSETPMSAAEIIEHKFSGMDYSMGLWKKNLSWIEEAKKDHLITNVWTVNNENDMQEMIDLGMDCITTNYPDILEQLIKNNNQVKIK